MVHASQDPTRVNLTAMEAANRLALQRMAMFQEDQETAVKVTRKNTAKGKSAAGLGKNHRFQTLSDDHESLALRPVEAPGDGDAAPPRRSRAKHT